MSTLDELEKAYVEHAIVCEAGCTPVSRCAEGERLFQRWMSPDAFMDVDGYLAGRSNQEKLDLGLNALRILNEMWPKVPEAERPWVVRVAVEYGRVIQAFERWGIGVQGLMAVMAPIGLVKQMVDSGIPTEALAGALAEANLAIPEDFLRDVVALLEAAKCKHPVLYGEDVAGGPPPPPGWRITAPDGRTTHAGCSRCLHEADCWCEKCWVFFCLKCADALPPISESET